jgi:hypothetical protein
MYLLLRGSISKRVYMGIGREHKDRDYRSCRLFSIPVNQNLKASKLEAALVCLVTIQREELKNPRFLFHPCED